MANYAMPTSNVPFLDASGNVAFPWFMFMAALFQSVGGPAVIPGGSIISMEKATAPVLLNSWANYGAGFLGAGYYKDVFGIVHLQGTIKSGAIGANPAFTLPVGYRPSASINFTVVSDGAVSSILINAAGEVRPYLGNNAFVANGAAVALDGLTFRAA